MFDLVSAAFKQTAEQYGKLARSLPDVVNVVSGMLKPDTAHADHVKGKLGQNFAFGPKTPINVPITGQRSFACTSLPLAQIKQIGARHGAKLNDVVLAICSGALRSYLQHKHKLPRKSLIATVPVSLREPGNTATTTQATLTLVSLASHISDPQKRLHAICKAAGAAKSLTQNAKTVIPTDFPSLGVPWLLGGLASLYGYSKLAQRDAADRQRRHIQCSRPATTTVRGRCQNQRLLATKHCGTRPGAEHHAGQLLRFAGFWSDCGQQRAP
jgi:diacylglycerol O-acyltransferase